MKIRFILLPALGVLLLGGPILECFTPAAPLTAQEQQCCAEMEEGCGTSSLMPESHSCCEAVLQTHSEAIPSASLRFSFASQQVPAIDAGLALAPASSLIQFASSQARAHAPPGPSLLASVPLRI